MLIIVALPSTLPVSVAQAVTHCRAPDNGDDDDLIRRALQSAVEYVEQQTNLVLAPQEFELRQCYWPCWEGGFRRGYEIDLPKKPVRDIVSVEYLDADGNLQTVDAANYSWFTTAEGAAVRFKNDYSFPTLYTDDEPVRITFAAGFDDPEASGSGDDPNLKLPQRAVEAVLLKTELGYERGGHSEAAAKQLNAALDALMGQLRVYR